MAVKIYSRKKDGKTKLSANLKVGEFACKDGSDAILIDDELVRVLQAIRDHFRAPLKLTSGYRTPAYNKRVGGVTASQHTLGKAADINVDGETPVQLFRVIANGEVAGIDPAKLGLGLYQTFVHVDTRGRRARWAGTGVREDVEK